MTLEKAIERLYEIGQVKKSVLLYESQDAIMLGIEAMKSLQQIRQGPLGYISLPLPGETPE